MKFDKDRPGFVWSHCDYQQSISEHRLASRIPQHSKALHPTIHDGAEVFHDLVTRPDHPTKITDWIESDHPALSVHVVSFTDATLVSLSWPHVLWDALGQRSLLQAWTAVLDGREEDVPSFVPYEEDPMLSVPGTAKPTDHVLYASALTGLWFIMFVISFIYEMVVHSKEAERIVRLPGPWVEKLRDQAMGDLITKGAWEKDLFLSHGDVLLAFWCKTTMAAQHLRPSQPVHIMNLMNIRGTLKNLPSPWKQAYIGNAAMISSTFTTAADIRNLSVGELALRVRKDLEKQREPNQVRSLVSWYLDCFKKGAHLPMSGPWNQTLMSWSNWHRAKYYEVDFSSAVVNPGLEVGQRTTKLGQSSFVMCSAHVQNISVRNAGPLMGRDANGDWWLGWVMRAEAWSEVEKAFEKEWPDRDVSGFPH